MLLVFGGTTEGKRAAEALSKAGRAFIYSTKLPVKMPALVGMTCRHGAFNIPELVSYCAHHRVRGIVNASHPFADALHKVVGRAAEEASLPVWRYERTYAERNRPSRVLHYVPDYQAAIASLERLATGPVLALTGVQTIAKLRTWWERHPTYFQILDRPESHALAHAQGFPSQRILARAPASTPEELLCLIRTLGASAMITKESGESGYQHVKEQAAATAGIPLVIVQRPALPARFVPVYDDTQLLSCIEGLLG